MRRTRITICTTNPDLPSRFVQEAERYGIQFVPLQTTPGAPTSTPTNWTRPGQLTTEEVQRQFRVLNPDAYLMNGPPDYGPFVDLTLISSAPNLRLVTYHGDSLNPDHYESFIDVKALTRRGITVTTTPGARHSVAEGTFAMILALNLGLVQMHVARKAGGDHYPRTRTGLYGGTLGIAGMGEIGRQVAEIGRAFEMEIVYSARSRKRDIESLLGARFLDLPELFAQSDIVSIHLPGATSQGLIDRDVLRRARGITLVNSTSDPGIINPDALLSAIDKGNVAKVAIEGSYPEPYDGWFREYPDDRVLLLPPYISWDTVQTRRRSWDAYLQTLQAFVDGRPVPYRLLPRDSG